MTIDGRPSWQGRRSLSIDIIDFLSDLTDQGGRHTSVVADRVLHIRWEVSMGRPIAIGTDDDDNTICGKAQVRGTPIGVTVHLYGIV